MAHPLEEVVGTGLGAGAGPGAGPGRGDGGVPAGRAGRRPTLPAGRGPGLRRLPDPLRAGPGARGRPGPVPDPGPPHRVLLLRRAGRAAVPEEPAEHLPGVRRRPRPPHAGHRRPHPLGRSGRAAAQPRPDGAPRRPGLAPRPGLGARHRPGDPCAGRPRRAAAWRSCGAATPASCAPTSATCRPWNRPIRAPCRPTGGSSAAARSPVPTRCWSSRGRTRSTGGCPDDRGEPALGWPKVGLLPFRTPACQARAADGPVKFHTVSFHPPG